MSFASNINRICAEKGTTLTKVVKAVKSSSSFVTPINNGALPKEHEMVKMAQILGCSVMDFFADDESVPTAAPLGELSADEMDILNIYRSLSRRQQHEFMAMTYNYEAQAKLVGDNDDTAI